MHGETVKSAEKIQVPLKSNKHKGYFMWTRAFTIISVLLLEIEMFLTKAVGKNQNTFYIQ